jgi:hypothetical protein
MNHAGTAAEGSEPVEEYLDRLLLTLGGSPRYVRHTLAEVEAHLHDAVSEEISRGLSRQQAEAAAVARIGPVQAVSGRNSAFAHPTAALFRRSALAGTLVGGVALVAYGISGAIGWAMADIRGGSFLTAPFPPGSYTRADCDDWLTGDPATHNCVTAMISDHVGDIVLQGFAAGLLGIIALLAFAAMRRRWQDRATLTALPVGSAEAAGAVLAALVTVAGLVRWINIETNQQAQGAGQPLSIAMAAACAATFFAVRLYRAVRPRGPVSMSEI